MEVRVGDLELKCLIAGALDIFHVGLIDMHVPPQHTHDVHSVLR